MKELINNELAQLQKDLENLQSASHMISQAGRASDAVIEEAKGIHEDFAKNLDKLTTLYSEFLEAANKQSSQNQLLVVEHVKSTITEQSSLLDKYNALVESANSNTKSLYEQAVASQAENINKLMEESSRKLDAQSQLVKSNAAAAALNVETVKEAYLKQSAETDKLLSSYLELAQSTAELKDKIESVDFPSRLDKISQQILEYTEQQKALNETSAKILEAVKSDKVLKQAQSNEKTLSSIKTIATCVLIFVLLGVAAVAYLIFKGMH